MRFRLRAVGLFICCAAAVCAAPAYAQDAATRPAAAPAAAPSPGRDLVAGKCFQCHTDSMFRDGRMDRHRGLVTATGYVIPQLRSKVGAKMPGRIAKVFVKEEKGWQCVLWQVAPIRQPDEPSPRPDGPRSVEGQTGPRS